MNCPVFGMKISEVFPLLLRSVGLQVHCFLRYCFPSLCHTKITMVLGWGRKWSVKLKEVKQGLREDGRGRSCRKWIESYILCIEDKEYIFWKHWVLFTKEGWAFKILDFIDSDIYVLKSGRCFKDFVTTGPYWFMTDRGCWWLILWWPFLFVLYSVKGWSWVCPNHVSGWP